MMIRDADDPAFENAVQECVEEIRRAARDCINEAQMEFSGDTAMEEVFLDRVVEDLRGLTATEIMVNEWAKRRDRLEALRQEARRRVEQSRSCAEYLAGFPAGGVK